jgi:hypothetical protein
MDFISGMGVAGPAVVNVSLQSIWHFENHWKGGSEECQFETGAVGGMTYPRTTEAIQGGKV